ncbi:MAG TPA: hypothetical protein VL912_07285, partial [Candidatus Udaeobacter sp.]|nr:hypothetical protein [Candidatus Udaeobacter sp.]
MGIFGIGRGVILAAAIMFALALLKKMIIVFGFLLAFIKFGIVLAFIVLIVSIAVAMFRDRSGSRSGAASS